MRRPVMTLSQLVLALSLSHALGAQGPPVRPGDRVRLTVPSSGADTFIATIESTSSDTIRLRTSRGVQSVVPLDRVERLEVFRGVSRPMWSKTAPLWVTLVGFTGGAIGGYAKPASREIPREAGLHMGVVAGVLGLVAGTAVAVAVPGREKWETVPIATRARGSLAPSLYAAPGARGLTLGLHASF